VSPSRSGAWLGPDLARAKRLVAASGTRGEHVTVWGWTDDPTIAPAVITYTAGVLRRLGFRTGVRLIRHAQFDRLPVAVRNNIQLIPTGWLDTTPEGFVPLWLSCNGAYDHGYFCDPAIDRSMQHADGLQAINTRAAAALWARIDHELVDRAAWVPLVNDRQVDFVSPHVANFQHHPYWDLLADQLVIR
jgi:peptide/nickel transport system substrate-binding protein